MSLKSTGLCSCPKGLHVTIITAIQTYGIRLLPRNFTQNSVKFCGNTAIPRQRPNYAARLEIPRPAENCGPYLLYTQRIKQRCAYARNILYTQRCVVCNRWCQDTSAPGQFGTKTLRHQTTGAEVSGHFGTNFVLVPNCLTAISDWCQTV